MKTISGQLHLTKTEAKNIRLMLDHARQDLSYGAGGTYFISKLGDNDWDEKNAKKAKEAIIDIEWILSIAVIK